MKIGILKTCICCHDLNGFLIHHDFDDKIHGDSDECGFHITLENVLTSSSRVQGINPQHCNVVIIVMREQMSCQRSWPKDFDVTDMENYMVVFQNSFLVLRM